MDALTDNLRSGKIPTYNVIKDQGAEYIRANFGKKMCCMVEDLIKKLWNLLYVVGIKTKGKEK